MDRGGTGLGRALLMATAGPLPSSSSPPLEQGSIEAAAGPYAPRSIEASRLRVVAPCMFSAGWPERFDPVDRSIDLALLKRLTPRHSTPNPSQQQKHLQPKEIKDIRDFLQKARRCVGVVVLDVGLAYLGLLFDLRARGLDPGTSRSIVVCAC